jgi:hypothetical protein
MNLNVNELDLLPAVEETGGGPELYSGCCLRCYSSINFLTNGCDD